MTAFTRVEYNFNSRFILNDDTTDPTKYVLVGLLMRPETETLTTEVDRPTLEGIIDFGSKLSGGVIPTPITLFASSLGKMNDLVDTLKKAFNPQLIDDDTSWGKGILNFPAGDGFMPFKWTEEIASGTRAVQVFAKSLEVPSVSLDTLGGRIKTGMLRLRIEDPRKYAQALSSLTGAGTAANAGNYYTPVKITITATGTTSTSLQIANSTRSETIKVTTALTTGQSLVIDTRHQSVKLDGTEKRSMLSSDSKWIQLSPGNNTIAITNGDNATIKTEWYSAYAL